MTDLSYLFSPVKLGNCEIRNRIMISGHATLFSFMGMPTERYIDYYGARAKGGVGLIVMEAVAVSPHAALFGDLWPVHGWKDEIIPMMKKISTAVHAHGGKIFCQAWHNGNENTSMVSGIHTQSCSPVPSAGIGEVPSEMTPAEIRETIRMYADFARRLKESEFDGVELHFAHGYLPQQFLSPLYNLRSDAYGGSFENRMRFGLELIDQVRTAVGKNFVVGLRISGDELVQGGYTLEDMKQMAPVWDQTGQIDYLNVTVGNYKSVAPVIAPMMIPPKPFTYMSAEIREQVNVPVVTAIRITDPVMANDIIQNGEADMVVMTRATICDSEMPNKAKAGRLDDIRQCVGCNEGCWERILHCLPVTCAQNPESGNEGTLKLEPAPQPKTVMVIGGGVAGMKAATVARERGHQVTLYEKTSTLGGAITIAAQAPSRAELGQVARFLAHELERLNVSVRLNCSVTADMVQQESPDVVVIATGASTIERPDPEVVGPDAAIAIREGAHVVTAEDVLQGKAETGQRVVIADQQRFMKGMVTAEFLADQGKTVTVIAPYPFRLHASHPYDIDGATETIQVINLNNKSVTRIADHAVKAVEDGKVTIQDQFTEKEKTLEADTLVLSFWRQSENGLYNDLEGKVPALYRIGDCVSPRRYIDAIHEGYKIGSQV